MLQTLKTAKPDDCELVVTTPFGLTDTQSIGPAFICNPKLFDESTSSVCRENRCDSQTTLISKSDAKGQQFTLSYDGLGRMTEREDWSNDPSGISCGRGLRCETDTIWNWGVTPGNHDVGQLDLTSTTTTDGTYSEQRLYDGFSRLGNRIITIPGDATYEYTLSYNPQGLLSKLQFPAAGSNPGVSLNYSYQNGVVSSVTDASSGTAYWQVMAAGGIGEVNGLGEITADALGNGIVTERTFTPAGGWLSKVISGTTAGSASAQNQTYSYDVLGNVTERQDNNQGLTEDFPEYDGDNRLQQSTLLNSGTSTTTTNLSVSYNADGSISHKSETGGTDTPVEYSVNWTSYNYPQSISATPSSGQNESATFDYGGPDRQRWRMVYSDGSGSETTEYIGGLMEKVMPSTGGVDYRYYVYGADELAAIVSVDGSGTVTPRYALEDQEGSISSLLSSTGTVAANESFTAFGNRREAGTWSGPPSSTEEAAMDAITRQGFTGQTVLGQMGLNHMNGRVEDTVTGTFLSPDPYVNDPTSSQDYYRYTYAYNNPLRYVDPTGFDTTPTVTCDDGECPALPPQISQITIQASWLLNLQLENMEQSLQFLYGSTSSLLAQTGDAISRSLSEQMQQSLLQKGKSWLCSKIGSNKPFVVTLDDNGDFQFILFPGVGGGTGIGITSNGQVFVELTAQGELGELTNLSIGLTASIGRTTGNLPVRQPSTEGYAGGQGAVGSQRRPQPLQERLPGLL